MGSASASGQVECAQHMPGDLLTADEAMVIFDAEHVCLGYVTVLAGTAITWHNADTVERRVIVRDDAGAELMTFDIPAAGTAVRALNSAGDVPVHRLRDRDVRRLDRGAGGMTEPLLDHAGMEILSPDECRQLLAETAVGRIAFVEGGEPTILPITIGMWDGAIVFTTGHGSKLEAAITERPVAVEIDGWDATTRTGWSVVVKGTATHVDDGREIGSLDRLSVSSWVRPGVPKDWVRINATEITGRRVPVAPGGTTEEGS